MNRDTEMKRLNTQGQSSIKFYLYSPYIFINHSSSHRALVSPLYCILFLWFVSLYFGVSVCSFQERICEVTPAGLLLIGWMEMIL